jgi:phosphate transport system protein
VDHAFESHTQMQASTTRTSGRRSKAVSNSRSSRKLRKSPSKPSRNRPDGAQDELTQLALKACLIARDATFNVRDLLTTSSRMAFIAVRDCEKELDQIERSIDERLPEAITRVSEEKARELLACLKSITDLERIGDLLAGVAHRVHSRGGSLATADVEKMVEMATILHTMLDRTHQGFLTRDLDCAREVLRVDSKIDHICHQMFQKHLANIADDKQCPSLDVLLMAQALERAGDHAKNLAEELYSLIEGHSLRHSPKRTTPQ